MQYGVVEHRFAAAAPAPDQELLRRYGHSSIVPTRYSTSSFVSHALGHLYRERLLARTDVVATGYWYYLRVVPAFAQPETAPNIETISGTAFATKHDIDSDTWLDDRIRQRVVQPAEQSFDADLRVGGDGQGVVLCCSFCASPCGTSGRASDAPRSRRAADGEDHWRTAPNRRSASRRISRREPGTCIVRRFARWTSSDR